VSLLLFFQRKEIVMPKNKKESFVFTLMMCSLMVFVMSLYNVTRIHGVSNSLLIDALKGFPLGFIVALVADWFLVGPLAKKIAFKFIKPDDPMLKKAITISSCMVVGMVFIMSLFGAIMGVGLSSDLLIIWLVNIPLNFIVAYPLQIVLVGPLVRFGFSKIYA